MTVLTAEKPVATATPSQRPQIDMVASHAVPHRIFADLASGALSALVVPFYVPTQKNAGITVLNEKTGAALQLQMGETVHAVNEPGLRFGYKAVEVMHLPRLPHEPTQSRDLSPPLHKKPSVIFSAESLQRRNFVIKYGAGGINHYQPPLLNGGVIALREVTPVPTKPDEVVIKDRNVYAAVVMTGDMPGLQSGYELVTPPQRQQVASRSAAGPR